MKRILTIQDISCLGKCSITIALPVISALGTETVILPTAVLSNHTLFKSFTVKDLADQIEPICEKWVEENIEFDAIYTGYLGTIEQIDMMKELFKTFKKDDDTIVFVDPVMADNGKLYPAFDSEFPKEMAKLCAKADIVLPNITEACFLTDTEYREEYDEEFAKDVVKKLAAQGAKKVVLTGAAFDGSYGVLVYDSETDEFYNYQQEKIDAAFHGTGDIFSSAFTGSLVRGKSLEESVKIAADYTAECIRITKASPNANWYGVDFERAIPFLLKLLEA